MEVTFGLLAVAVIALWLERGHRVWDVPWWAWFAIASLVAALASGVVQPLGVIGVAAWTGIVVAWMRVGRSRPILAVGVLGMAAALMLHVVPGFANPRVIDGVRFTADAVPFSLHLNYDKTLVGLLLFGWVLPRVASGSEWRVVLAAMAPRALVVLGVVMVASLATGYVRWAPKLPAEAPLWCAVNLLSTCVAEEALFRGFVQGGLRRAWERVREGRWWALAVAAGLFGVAHAAGGATYVALATVAGAGYGWVYEKTQRVEASVITHFALNALHFFLFTYPALDAGG